MIATIVTLRSGGYGARMRIAAIRLLTLAALLVMPFAMAAAPAAPPETHHASAQMSPGHCSDQPEQSQQTGRTADCAMPCSAALPAVEIDRLALTPVLGRATDRFFEPALDGILLEIATPPPKL